MVAEIIIGSHRRSTAATHFNLFELLSNRLEQQFSFQTLSVPRALMESCVLTVLVMSISSTSPVLVAFAL